MRSTRNKLNRYTPGLVLLLLGCAQAPDDVAAPAGPAGTQIDPPAASGAFAPSLSASDGEVLLTWWERLPEPEGEGQHRLMFARRAAGTWGEATVVAQGEEFFANWADIPSVIREPSGSLLVHWLSKTGSDTYAYSIYLARSTDEGRTWTPLGPLNDDATDTEHGFVSMVPDGEAVRAYWLDGRQMVDGGPMTVRSALIGDEIGPSELLDDRVCECCPTDAAATQSGSLVVFRNRSDEEVREIHGVQRSAEGWSESFALSADEWKIPGCPVNGPAIDSAAGRTAVAWFTGVEGRPRVSVGFSSDLPSGFESVAVVDDGTPLGRVGLVLTEAGEAIVSWLAIDDKAADLSLRRVAADGSMGESLIVGRTSAGRSSGIPQLGRVGDNLLVAWVEVREGSGSIVRMRELPTDAVPEVSTVDSTTDLGG